MKVLFKLSAVALLLVVVILGCHKMGQDKQSSQGMDGAFTLTALQQWYSKSFQRSSEFNTAWSKSKNFPDWKSNGTYRKEAGLEFLELPLFRQHTSLLVRSEDNLTAAQKGKIASAALSRVVFIRNSRNEIFVRMLEYIPDWEYLQAQQFDIHKASYGEPGNNFSGTFIVRDWNGRLLTMHILKDGKVIRNVSVQRNPAPASTHRMQTCTWVTYCMWYEDCDVVGDQWTDNCGEPYMDPNDCYDQEECDGQDDDPCATYGIGCGGDDGGDNNPPPPPPPPDPCTDAQPSANKTTNLSHDGNYSSAKSSIQTAAADNNEHSITFGKDASNNITTSPMDNSGGSSSGNVNTSWPGAFADLHNHPDDQPPSPGDLYGIVSVNQNHSGYDTRMVVTSDGSVYALVVVNASQAASFVSNYPKQQIGNFPPDFPDPIFTDFDDARLAAQMNGNSHQVAEEMAMAYVMDKYNTGMALLKQDSNGNFKRLKTDATTTNGNTVYTANNCQ